MAYTPVTLRELRDKFGIEIDRSSNAHCPFCDPKGDKRALLHFNDSADTWRCSRCEASGGVLKFFARYQLGIETYPSDPTERKKIRREMYEFLGYNNPSTPRPIYTPLPEEPGIPAASDDHLHAVYSAMSSLALFRLSTEHKKDLRRRGLSDAVIERNGYRTYPFKTQVPQRILDLYNTIDPIVRKKVSQKQAAHIQLGLYVASSLEELGYNLQGVPGFYKFGGHWCLTYSPGMLIPTRNSLGQIVLWQVRRANQDPKYLTLSCSKAPGAVNKSVSRCHFPMSNDALAPEHRFIITEGPLKADIAKALSSDPCVYAAIPGIGNRDDLLSYCEKLKEAGITTVYNALDMDRLTKRSVMDGSARLEQAFQEQGIQVVPMYWDAKYAEERLWLYSSLAHAHCIPVPEYPFELSVYAKLRIVADALYRAGIKPEKAAKCLFDWDSNTKGIDDYLLSKKERKAPRQPSTREQCIRAVQEMQRKLNEPDS